MTDSTEQVAFLVGTIEKLLASYENGQSSLAQLVRGVESAIDELAHVSDADWVAELRRSWGTLEITYAVALDEGRSSLSDEERCDVKKAVVALRALIMH